MLQLYGHWPGLRYSSSTCAYIFCAVSVLCISSTVEAARPSRLHSQLACLAGQRKPHRNASAALDNIDEVCVRLPLQCLWPAVSARSARASHHVRAVSTVRRNDTRFCICEWNGRLALQGTSYESHLTFARFYCFFVFLCRIESANIRIANGPMPLTLPRPSNNRTEIESQPPPLQLITVHHGIYKNFVCTHVQLTGQNVREAWN